MEQAMTMMTNNDRIETEVRKTMEVLDNLPRLQAHYLFGARVMERISHETLTGPQETVSAMRGVKLGLMVFLLIVNIGSALVLMLSNGTEQTFSKQDTIESLTNEYSSPALSYYLDNDNIEESNE
ncbi:MAG: hypothetical protein MI684_05920 [Chlorobiales bacterium]|nr:hypothetical protein [Chlorobiales bacterium]